MTAFSCGKSKIEKKKSIRMHWCVLLTQRREKKNEVIRECDWQHLKKKNAEHQRNIHKIAQRTRYFYYDKLMCIEQRKNNEKQKTSARVRTSPLRAVAHLRTYVRVCLSRSIIIFHLKAHCWHSCSAHTQKQYNYANELKTKNAFAIFNSYWI